MQTLDSTIANVALPHMQGSMSSSLDQTAWVLTSYVMATAICTPLTGFLERRLGRRRLFLISVTGFTVASLLCGIAQTLPEIVLFRALQGAAGACIIPMSQSVMLDLFPPAQRGPAMALWGMGVMLGPIIGPTLGGYLTDVHSWRMVFLINIPLGVLAVVGIGRYLDDTPIDRNSRFDWLGFTALSVALGSLQLMLDRGQTHDWFGSVEITAELLVAIAAFWVFLVHTYSARNPYISPELFRDVNFNVGLIVIGVLGLVMLATMALLPTFLQNLLGYPVQTAGLLLAPRGVGTMVAMSMVGRLVQRFDARYLVGIGVVLMAFSLWQMAQFTLDTGPSILIWSGVIQGMGMGFVFVPLSVVTFYTLSPRLRTEGASIYSLVRNIGSSIGVSVVVSFLSRAHQENHAILVEHLTPYSNAIEQGASRFDPSSPSMLPMLELEVNRQAGILSYVQDFQYMAAATIIALPLLLLLKPAPKIVTAPVKNVSSADVHA